MTELVTAVTGEVPPGVLGVTLAHEHVLHQISLSSGKPDNTCVDREIMVEELLRFKAAGGGAVCDVTPAGLGRDPAGLREISKRSGVTIVSGMGLYTVETLPEAVKGLPQKKLADYLVGQAEGEGTGIRAGLIGEIASHNENHSDRQKYRLTEREEEIFLAVAEAQRRTGLCVSTHASLGRGGPAQVQALLKGGADPKRVIIGHCDAQSHPEPDKDMDYYHRLLEEGVMLSFDLFGWEGLMPDETRCRRIGALAAQGFSDRILISTDTCRCSQLHRFGGRGFDYLFHSVIPRFLQAGTSEATIRQMTVLNPARMLARASY
jgi:predicted metal-dependent phosphotriesterase family hydrolase